jgi:hypothetical protein
MYSMLCLFFCGAGTDNRSPALETARPVGAVLVYLSEQACWRIQEAFAQLGIDLTMGEQHPVDNLMACQRVCGQAMSTQVREIRSRV